MLRFQNISASYQKDYPILSDVNLYVETNEKIAILGRNGAGKTTFANTIFGLVPFITGKVLYEGENIVSKPSENITSLGIGYFMQGAPVFPQMSVKENLLLSAGSIGQHEFLSRYDYLKDILPLLLDKGITRMPAGSLSGGERTQLSLAMAIFKKPALLILDEPFAGLSPSNASLILRTLLEYQEINQASILLIAQDRNMASEFCSNHFIIRDGKFLPDSVCT